jgi:hypothetical protein
LPTAVENTANMLGRGIGAAGRAIGSATWGATKWASRELTSAVLPGLPGLSSSMRSQFRSSAARVSRGGQTADPGNAAFSLESIDLVLQGSRDALREQVGILGESLDIEKQILAAIGKVTSVGSTSTNNNWDSPGFLKWLGGVLPGVLAPLGIVFWHQLGKEKREELLEEARRQAGNKEGLFAPGSAGDVGGFGPKIREKIGSDPNDPMALQRWMWEHLVPKSVQRPPEFRQDLWKDRGRLTIEGIRERLGAPTPEEKPAEPPPPPQEVDRTNKGDRERPSFDDRFGSWPGAPAFFAGAGGDETLSAKEVTLHTDKLVLEISGEGTGLGGGDLASQRFGFIGTPGSGDKVASPLTGGVAIPGMGGGPVLPIQLGPDLREAFPAAIPGLEQAALGAGGGAGGGGGAGSLAPSGGGMPSMGSGGTSPSGTDTTSTPSTTTAPTAPSTTAPTTGDPDKPKGGGTDPNKPTTAHVGDPNLGGEGLSRATGKGVGRPDEALDRAAGKGQRPIDAPAPAAPAAPPASVEPLKPPAASDAAKPVAPAASPPAPAAPSSPAPSSAPPQQAAPPKWGVQVDPEGRASSWGAVSPSGVLANRTIGLFGIGMNPSVKGAQETMERMGPKFNQLPKDIQEHIRGAAAGKNELDLGRIAPHVAPNMTPQQHEEMWNQGGIRFTPPPQQKSDASPLEAKQQVAGGPAPEQPPQDMTSDSWWKPMMSDQGSSGGGRSVNERAPQLAMAGDLNPGRPDAGMPNVSPIGKDIFDNMWVDSISGSNQG